MRGKIGILYPNKTQRGQYMVNNAYLDYFKKFGKLESIAPYEAFNPNLKALVLTGGADINPNRYGEYPTLSGDPNIEYDYFDEYILPQYVAAGIPIIGVCRGLQSLYVHYGGKLNQHVHLPSSTSGGVFTQHNNKGSRGKIVENMRFITKYKYLTELRGYESGINSLHHQTVNLDYMPKEIQPMAFSLEHNNLELMTVRGKNIIAFQGHMEELKNTVIFDHLIKNTLNERLADWN